MNYEKHYTLLIEKCNSRNWSKSSAPCYVEVHHIIPRCLGGTDDSNNLVVMSAREHFIAHLLLAKIHGGKLWYAANMLLSQNSQQTRDRVNSRTYSTIKKNVAEQARLAKLGTTMCEETKTKISNSLKGRIPWNKGIPTTKEKSKHQSDFMKKNNPMTSEESRKRISDARKRNGEPQLTCPHCDKTMDARNAKRWHFDNCKLKVHTP